MMRGALAFALLMALPGCAHRLQYDPLGLTLPPTAEMHAAGDAARAVLAERLIKGDLPSLHVGDAAAPFSVDETAALPAPLAYCAWAGGPRFLRGMELDLLLDDPSGSLPVTLWVATNGAIRVDWRPAWSAARATSPAADIAEALRAEIGFADVTDGTASWTADELFIVQRALRRLGPAERDALAGTRLTRNTISPRAARRELAYYDPRREPATIEIFDLAFPATSDTFIGPLNDPEHAATMTILHEVAHAIADAKARGAWIAWQRARVAGMDARPYKRAYRSIGRRGPVIDAWVRARTYRGGPTPFARRDPHEAFAEAFALYWLDRDALQRVMPWAVAWFDAGHHLPR